MNSNHSAPDAPRLFNLEEAADRLSLHPATLRRFLREGKISGLKIGRNWRITPDALSAYIATLSGDKSASNAHKGANAQQ